jgi:uncharacterized membrane protein (UPF0127 family)
MALALLLAACGSGEVTPAATSAAVTPAATATTAPAESTSAPATTPAGTSSPAPAAEPTASSGATPRDQLPVVEFLRADGVVVSLPVEVPPRSEYGIGLSGRYQLDERGMLFHYSDPESHIGFWMKNTHIDLAIAFVSSDFRIVEIHQMEAESLDIIRPQAAHQYAVEAPAGWYDAHGVAVGDRVRFTFELPEDGGG